MYVNEGGEAVSTTHHREHMYFIFRPRRELVERQLLSLVLDFQARAVRRRRRHPHIGMRGVLYTRAHGHALQFARENIEHRLTRYERRRSERYSQFIMRAVVVPAHLLRAAWHTYGVQSGHFGRLEVVECGVNVPAEETRRAVVLLVRGRDGGLVEGAVRGVFESGGLESLVVVHGAVADQLDLWNARDRLEVWMENRLFGRLGLVVAMSVGFGRGVEGLVERPGRSGDRFFLCDASP